MIRIIRIEWWIYETRLYPFLVVLLFGRKIFEIEPRDVQKRGL
jgi:hypothetical protein